MPPPLDPAPLLDADPEPPLVDPDPPPDPELLLLDSEPPLEVPLLDSEPPPDDVEIPPLLDSEPPLDDAVAESVEEGSPAGAHESGVVELRPRPASERDESRQTRERLDVLHTHFTLLSGESPEAPPHYTRLTQNLRAVPVKSAGSGTAEGPCPDRRIQSFRWCRRRRQRQKPQP